MTKVQQNKREIRHRRVRAKIFGTASRPRLSIYRSNKHLFLQLIDDESGKTLFGVSDKALKFKGKSVKKSDVAYSAGKSLARKALEFGIKKAVFDRGGYKYHGRVARAADGVREEGLQF